MQLSHTPDGATCRPGGDGVPPLVEQDVGPPGAHFLLWHQVNTAVVVAVPLAVHRVPAVGCNRVTGGDTPSR